MVIATPHGSYDWCSLSTMHDTIVNTHMSNSKSNIPLPVALLLSCKNIGLVHYKGLFHMDNDNKKFSFDYLLGDKR
jgi:hypothetical protein